jgi:ribonuclease BN (tRNA processing enzyme)
LRARRADTAGQAPTRHRNHNGYVLRRDGAGLLFDPGEGMQRQMLLAGVPSSAITRICLSHVHGDHGLGVPGVIQRLARRGRAPRAPLPGVGPALLIGRTVRLEEASGPRPGQRAAALNGELASSLTSPPRCRSSAALAPLLC